MYCVIQAKRTRKECEDKKIGLSTWESSINGVTVYGYSRVGEGVKLFKRPHNISYKVSIQHSYRENGKVKKKSWHLTTFRHYDLIDWACYIGDHVHSSKLNALLDDIGISENEFYDIVQPKIDKLQDKVVEEHKQTEEYKEEQRIETVLKEHRSREKEFESKYGEDTYRTVYDVYGTLRNADRLEQLKKWQKQKEKQQQESYERFKNSYQSGSGNSGGSSYFSNSVGSYTEEEKPLLKKFFRILSKEFHPDTKNGSEEAMKLVNKLNESWK